MQANLSANMPLQHQYTNYKAEFFNSGFVVIPNILSPEVVEQLRQVYMNEYACHGTLTLRPSELLSNTQIADQLFSHDVFSAISEVVGEGFCLYPDFSMRQNLYIPWHTDTSYLTQQETDTDPTANFVQMSIYLQDNNRETGGGLEVIEGSHHMKEIDRAKPGETTAVNLDTDGTLLQSMAGDLVFWDSRIVHRSIANKTPLNPKLAIQWTVSRHGRYADKYLAYLARRAKQKLHVSDKIDNRETEFVKDIPNISFPNSFSQKQLAMLSDYDIEVKNFK